MQINNISATSYARQNSYANRQNSTNSPSFKGGANASTARKAFEWLGEKCNIDSNGSLTRSMFFAVGTLFMLGGRFFESRDNDEKREVVTRDIPAVALSCAGAPLLNQGVAYAITKKSGIPIVTNGKTFSIKNLGFTSQKQLTDWYSNLNNADNPLINLSEMVERNGGNIRKVMTKFGFADKLDAITDAKGNNEILTALKDAQTKGSESFKALENALKNVGKDNKVLKFAQNSQAAVKLGCIGFMAALLGYFLPHLNIITTKNKYSKKLQEGKIDQATYDIRMQRKSPVFRVSNGILSFHRTSAQKTYKNMLNMVENKNIDSQAS